MVDVSLMHVKQHSMGPHRPRQKETKVPIQCRASYTKIRTGCLWHSPTCHTFVSSEVTVRQRSKKEDTAMFPIMVGIYQENMLHCYSLDTAI